MARKQLSNGILGGLSVQDHTQLQFNAELKPINSIRTYTFLLPS